MYGAEHTQKCGEQLGMIFGVVDSKLFDRDNDEQATGRGNDLERPASIASQEQVAREPRMSAPGVEPLLQPRRQSPACHSPESR
jgi:hypothetical protein